MAELEQLRQEAEGLRRKIRVSRLLCVFMTAMLYIHGSLLRLENIFVSSCRHQAACMRNVVCDCMWWCL